jgi:F0F1-type ATP synthase assembly protein I
VALFGGLWIDKRFDTKPLFTVVLMLLSVPVTLIIMFWVVRKATARIRTIPPKKNPPAEEPKLGNKT